MTTALKRVGYPSPNYSSRGGATVRIICCHTAEGARTASDLGAFFANPGSGVSSHTGIDDTENTVWEYVQRSGKAWTQANANPYCVSTELCAFAEWSPAEWDRHPNMLANCAQWIAEEARYFGIPLVRLTAAQAQDGYSKGVCQHVDLGSAGGGHWDCGPGFPLDRVMAMAGGTTDVSKPPAEIQPPGDEMFIKSDDKKTYQLIYGGTSSYWREIPAGMVGDIPAAQVISDPNGSWKGLWKVGAGK